MITECWYAGGGDPTGSFAYLTRGLFIMALLGALVVLLHLRRRNLDFLHTYIQHTTYNIHTYMVYWLTHVGLAQSCTVNDPTCGSSWVGSENLQEHTGGVGSGREVAERSGVAAGGMRTGLIMK